MRRGLTLAVLAAWLAHAAASLARAVPRGLAPNALAGDVVQGAAFAALALLALHRGRVPAWAGAPLALAVAASAALGHPWRDVPAAPLLALGILAALWPARAGAVAAACAWAAFSALALATDPEPSVALLSHAIPGAIALAPLLARRVAPPTHLKPVSARAAWT